MVNTDSLRNISNPPVNGSKLNATELIPNAVDASFDIVGALFPLLIQMSAFLFIAYELNRKDGFFRYDRVASFTLSSGIIFLLSFSLLLADLIVNFWNVSIFALIFAVSMATSFLARKQ